MASLNLVDVSALVRSASSRPKMGEYDYLLGSSICVAVKPITEWATRNNGLPIRLRWCCIFVAQVVEAEKLVG